MQRELNLRRIRGPQMLQTGRGSNPTALPLYCLAQVKPSKPKKIHKVKWISKTVSCHNIQRELNLQPVWGPQMLKMGRGAGPAALPLYCPPQVEPSQPKDPSMVKCTTILAMY